MKTSIFAFTAWAAFTCVGLSGCVNTEVIEPSAGNKASETVVINIQAPAQLNTRAEAGYKIRYVAKMFEGASQLGSPIDRKEIAGDEASGGAQLIFKVAPDATYTVLVFADYIPVSYDYTDAAKTMYQDYFYNTSVKQGQINIPKSYRMMYQPGNADTQNLNEGFFNNINYDSFFALQTFEKTENEVVLNMELQRQVALVEFRDISSFTGNYTLTVNKIRLRPSLSYDNAGLASTYQNFTPALTMTKTASVAGQDVLYYYVFVTDYDGENEKLEIDMDITPQGGTKQKFAVSGIPIKRNYKTVVKGSYLAPASQDSGNNGGDGNGGSNNDDNGNGGNGNDDPTGDSGKIGDVILNLSSSSNWLGSQMVEMSEL